MSAMVLYAIGAIILVVSLSFTDPMEALYLAGWLFVLAGLGRAVFGD